MSEKFVFELDHIFYRHSQTQIALDDISFSVSKGDLIALTGANGSGKSTLLGLMSGLVFAESGELQFNGRRVTEKTLKNTRFNHEFRGRVGVVFQNVDAQLFCSSVWEELLFAPLQLGVSREEAEVRSRAVLKMFHIEQLAGRPGYSLSGGEKKRVAIASVLTANPSVLLLDEPLGGLDPRSRTFLIELILELHRAGKTIVFATHLLELVEHLQSRCIVLSEEHRLLRDASCREVLEDKDMLLRANLIADYPPLHLLHSH